MEAIVHGAYPIQTNTSCIDEWGNKGFIFRSVIMNPENIAKTFHEVIAQNYNSDFQKRNYELAGKELEKKTIKLKSLKFYL